MADITKPKLLVATNHNTSNTDFTLTCTITLNNSEDHMLHQNGYNFVTFVEIHGVNFVSKAAGHRGVTQPGGTKIITQRDISRKTLLLDGYEKVRPMLQAGPIINFNFSLSIKTTKLESQMNKIGKSDLVAVLKVYPDMSRMESIAYSQPVKGY